MTKTRKPRKPTTFEGLPLVDAAEDVAIVINKHDTTTSKKKDPANCAAALAGRREFKTDVRVYMSRIYVKDQKKKRWIRFVTPTSISKEITAFDRGAAFEPGEYVFKAPSSSQHLGYKTKIDPRGPHKTKKRGPYHHTANVRLHAKDKVAPGKS